MGGLSVYIRGLDTIAAPMPSHVEPMLATLSSMPADQEPFGFEYKWDGIRAVVLYDGKRLRIETRNLVDITDAYPELRELAGDLGSSCCVLDGELVALDRDGAPSFERMQRRLGLRPERALAMRAEVPVTYMVFDILHLEGRDLAGLPYEQRRGVLDGVGLSGPRWRTPPWYRGEGDAVLRAAGENGLEGIVAKRLSSPYLAGSRTRDWLKIKLVDRQEFVIGGWTPISTGGNAAGALLLGYYEPATAAAGGVRRLVYAGKVGTGFTDKERAAIAGALDARRTEESPFAVLPEVGEAVFAMPDLVAEVEFHGWTGAGRLRQPSFKGLRVDRDPGEVVREDRS